MIAPSTDHLFWAGQAGQTGQHPGGIAVRELVPSMAILKRRVGAVLLSVASLPMSFLNLADPRPANAYVSIAGAVQQKTNPVLK